MGSVCSMGRGKVVGIQGNGGTPCIFGNAGMELGSGGRDPVGNVGMVASVGAGMGVVSSRWRAAELVPMLEKSSRAMQKVTMMLLQEAT
ncbi:hypothetical protein CRG98_032413 [Punica granatum]|uniref:Uncharacterized protein n=1 Tax=Punica granatum TaxID=22663 RepID=A0A2I0IT49_PUNGR|nr:hypothetical protein CRG98_032413 [Punica granatum]